MEPSTSNGNNMKARIAALAKCPVCWLPYTNERKAPVTLPCGHTFCRECVNELGKDADNFRCGTCNARQWQSANRLEKNRQFVDLLIKIGVLQMDSTSDPNPPASNASAAANPPPVQVEVQQDVMAEVESINESLQRLSEIADNTLDRVRQIIVNSTGNRDELNRIVNRMIRLLRELSTHPLQMQFYRMHSRQRMDLIPQMQRDPRAQAGIPAELADDLALQAILLEQLENNRAANEQNPPNQNGQQGPGDIQNVVQQNINEFLRDMRNGRNPLAAGSNMVTNSRSDTATTARSDTVTTARSDTSITPNNHIAFGMQNDTDVTTAHENLVTAVQSNTDVNTAVENVQPRNENAPRTAVERGEENGANAGENGS